MEDWWRLAGSDPRIEDELDVGHVNVHGSHEPQFCTRAVCMLYSQCTIRILYLAYASGSAVFGNVCPVQVGMHYQQLG